LQNIKKSLVAAAGQTSFVDLSAAEKSIDIAKQLYGELSTSAIKENGKIVLSDEDVRDSRIHAAKQIALEEEKLAREKLRRASDKGKTADAQAIGDLNQKIDEAAQIGEVASKQINKSTDDINHLTFQLLQAKTNVSAALGEDVKLAASGITGQVSELAKALELVANSDPTKPIKDMDEVAKNASESLNTLNAELAAYQDLLKNNDLGFSNWGDRSLPNLHSGGLIPGRGDKAITALGHEYMMPSHAVDYYGTKMFDMYRSLSMPKNIFDPKQEQGTPAIVIQITPDVLKSTKDMTEDEIRYLTKRIAKSLEGEVSRTYMGRSVN